MRIKVHVLPYSCILMVSIFTFSKTGFFAAAYAGSGRTLKLMLLSWSYILWSMASKTVQAFNFSDKRALVFNSNIEKGSLLLTL
jgi:hypothetical protein